MGLYRSVMGLVRVRVTSADVPDFLRTLGKADISVLDGAPEEALAICFTLFRKDFKKVQQICEKRGDSLTVLGREGLYWTGKRLIKRPVLVLGTIILIFLLFWVPSHVFFVQVEGNVQVPDRLIIPAAEDCGICFGASRREVRSERVKNALLEAVPELQWAGVNTRGCVAVISVREKNVTEISQSSNTVSSIVAACDGVILSATATAGNLLCQPGQAVAAGQVLISGYTDSGLTIQATRAEGEVYARTRRKISVIAPAEYIYRTEVSEINVSYSLIIGKKRINLWKDSGISGTTCGRMYADYYITLPGGFQLPVALVKETVTEYKTVTAEISPEEAMSDFAGDYLLSQLIAGNIESREETYFRQGDVFLLEAVFQCTEMIGRQKAEEIGDLHG